MPKNIHPDEIRAGRIFAAKLIGLVLSLVAIGVTLAFWTSGKL